MSVVKNYILNLIYQILLLIIPLVTSPYIARVLGSEVIGIYTYTNSIATYFSLIAALGVGTYGARQIAYDKSKSKYDVSKTFWSIFLFKVITSTIILVIYFIFIFIYEREMLLLYIAQSIIIISTLFDISWLYIGFEEFKSLVIRNTFVRIISLILLFLLVKDTQDLLIYVYIINLPTLIGNLVIWKNINKYISLVKINFNDIIKHFKPSLKLLLPQLATQVYLLLDKVMLGKISEYQQVGYYEMAQRIVRIGTIVLTSLSEVIMPKIASEFSKGNNENILSYIRKSFSYNLFLSFPLTFGVIAISNTFVPWFLGPEFIETKSILKISAFLILILSIAHILVHQFLVPSGNENKFTISVCVGAAINFILNMILIKKIGALGAAIASIMAELSATIIQYIIVRKFINLKGCFKGVYKYFISAIIMWISVSLLGDKLQANSITVVLQIVLGGAIYISLNYILKSPAIEDVKVFMLVIIKKIKNKKI